ncbi:MAG: hypothetical protein A2521_11810 [Deltaproteobacteria bacterium RIFOXYD12_FULL_57_12]|nr:MAG: hypothetical protein A2521_11810 [Deltaproteobacteria bacterium RIFOXYD12_FULL_57_12]
MNRQAVLKAVLQSATLPTLPSVAAKLIEVTSHPEVTVQDIAKVISRDMALSAKILKIANSAFYAFPNQIGTINQAVAILGFNAVRSLALSFNFLSIKPHGHADRFDYKRFWEKSLAAAVAAKLIAETLEQVDPEEFFIAGLLQNIGEMVLARAFPTEYNLVLVEAEKNGGPLSELEQRLIGADHQDIGHEVARNWRFPAILSEPIRWHHEPAACQDDDDRVKMAVIIAHLAGLLAEILYTGHPRDSHREFTQHAREMLNLDEPAIERIQEKMHSELARIGQFFNLRISEPKSIEEILMEANAALSVLNMSYEQMNKELIQAKVRLQKLTQELEEKNRRLEKMATLDGLTEVYNHRYFQDFLDQEMSRAVRKETSLSLIMCDVDNFKTFNDKYGHQAGDAILRQLCAVLAARLREYDLLARYGGEEFAVVLPETGEEEAMVVAEKLRLAVSGQPFEIGLERYSVSMSFGVAALVPHQENFDKDDLISFADQALFESKKNGRNRVTRYEPKKKWFGKTWGLG